MNIWKDIEPKRITPDRFIAVIEISKGSKKKYELDKPTGMLILDRVLYTSTHYPANYGFVPLTYAGDDDPLDVIVLCQEPICELSLVEVYPIGVFKMIDSDQVDEKIVAIPFGDPNYNHYKEIRELPKHIIGEMKHFFEVYKQLENKKTYVLDIGGADNAKQIIAQSIEKFKEVFEK